MSKIRKQYSNPSIVSNIETRNLLELKSKTGNIYETIAVLSKRANQINTATKAELHNTLSDFSNLNDNLEEFYENKEQIEISRAYEKLPNAALLSIHELSNNSLMFRKNEANDLFN
ncbi:MAG: DNA-directed RNA polymerase subunit omega [Alphaproteobacteria bacterium]|nr:DNA-directed RNA polymerase subunit omega [Alphaproteobacteria bacterium]